MGFFVENCEIFCSNLGFFVQILFLLKIMNFFGSKFGIFVENLSIFVDILGFFTPQVPEVPRVENSRKTPKFPWNPLWDPKISFF